MDKKKIIVVGSGEIGKTVAESVGDHATYIQAIDDIFKEDQPMIQPCIIRPRIDLSQLDNRPKPNCKKGHNYEMVKEEKEGLLIKQTWKCRCGKVLN
jgi:hypothetical protein